MKNRVPEVFLSEMFGELRIMRMTTNSIFVPQMFARPWAIQTQAMS